MEAPTPASALIHSSTLVVAGVYLIIRFSLLFEFAYYVNLALALLGATTLAFSAVTATFQQDIKKLVAYSTISQIGYLVCGCGFGCYNETLIYLIIHAINKAFLFILVGYVVHNFSGNTDLRFMGNSHVFSFDVAVILLVLAANLSGLPYFAGFAGKEFLISQFFLSSPENLYIRAC
jgi:NADH-quinone oxidoreductase subunit L